ncbi:hypothetical protein ACF9IK_14200 [Kitasatospora hibisci]|uniref:hypothetical protein n=1 Tax=Kitasatospora hibisci TaxID=3369522 RepID=UPI0037542636
MADRESTAQIWGAAVVVASALAVVAAYLINGAVLVLVVAGVEVLLLMVHVGRRWRRLRRPAVPSGHQGAAGAPDAAHCERCRRAREALDARRARSLPRSGDRAERREAHRAEGVPVRDRAAHDPAAHGRAGGDLAGHDRSVRGCRPARDWTAERAAARSLDRPTPRHGAQGSVGRAVRHQ